MSGRQMLWIAPVVAGLVSMSSPQTEAAPPASPIVRVLSVTKTLPADGTDVPVTFRAKNDAIILELLTDNHPTLDQELCTLQDPGPPIECTESDYRLVSFTIDGKEFRSDEDLPSTISGSDQLEIRGLISSAIGSDVHLPLAGGSELVLTFDTENGSNDVALELTIGFIGGQGASFN